MQSRPYYSFNSKSFLDLHFKPKRVQVFIAEHPKSVCDYSALCLNAYKRTAGKERGMKENLFGIMMWFIPILTILYVSFFGYPSFFVSMIIVGAAIVLLLKEVVYVWRKGI